MQCRRDCMNEIAGLTFVFVNPPSRHILPVGTLVMHSTDSCTFIEECGSLKSTSLGRRKPTQSKGHKEWWMDLSPGASIPCRQKQVSTSCQKPSYHSPCFLPAPLPHLSYVPLSPSYPPFLIAHMNSPYLLIQVPCRRCRSWWIRSYSVSRKRERKRLWLVD